MTFWITWAVIAYLYIGGAMTLYAYAMDHRVFIKEGDRWRDFLKHHVPDAENSRYEGIRGVGYVILAFWPIVLPVLMLCFSIVALGRWLESKGMH